MGMSNPPREPMTDKDQEPLDSGLSRAYATLQRPMPPGHLDATILDAARREAGSRPSKRAHGFPVAWRLPLAVAAVVVLSVSLVTLMTVRDEVQPTAVPQPPSSTVRSDRPAKHAEPSSGVAPSTPAERASEANAKADAVGDRMRMEGIVAPRYPGAATATADARETESVVAEVAESSALHEQKRLAAPAGTLGAASVPLAQSPAPADAPAPQDVARAAAAKRAILPPAVAEGATSAGVEPTTVALLVRALDVAPPEKWLEKIGELRREGRQADADEVFREFRKRFPTHPVPQRLSK